MTETRVRLGELLIEAGIITRAQLDTVLELQKTDPRRLGALLIDSGIVAESQVIQVLSQQLSIPWVNLTHIEVDLELTELVPVELAERYCAVPLFIRYDPGQRGETLYVAMDDPTDETALLDLQEHAGVNVRAMIAPPSDIQAALDDYYGKKQTVPPDDDQSVPLI